MNVALLLTPISLVDTIAAKAFVADAFVDFTAHGYTAVPLVDHKGRYVGTLTEGDLLRLLQADPDAKLGKLRVDEVPLRVENKAVDVLATLPEVLERANEQNFVPVVDSRGVLMGIVTRRTVLDHLRAKAGL